jgi:aspartate/methionine/tyrosine aminotransferase
MLRQQISNWKDYTTICASAPSEILAETALAIGDKLIERSQSIIRTNLAEANSFFENWDSVFQWNQPQAGSVAFVRIRNRSAQEFTEQLLAEQGVLLLPSSVFRFGDQHLRFGFGRSDFCQGLAQLEQYLERHYSGGHSAG